MSVSGGKDEILPFTGGIAKYVELLMDDNATSRDRMIETMIAEDSSFVTEDKAKVDAFLATTGKFRNYRRSVKGLSLDDM